MIVDVYGTADEDRFWDRKRYDEGELVDLSKEYVRQYYRQTGYKDRLYQAREERKAEPAIPALPNDGWGDKPDLHQAVRDDHREKSRLRDEVKANFNKRKFKGNLSRDYDMKRVLLVILRLAALAISGCTENQDTPEKSVEDLKALSLSAAENLTSYSLKSTISNIRTLNDRGENATAENATIIKESAETTATVNLAGKQAQPEAPTTIEVEHRDRRGTPPPMKQISPNGQLTYIRITAPTHLQIR